MFCRNCGRQIDYNAAVCVNCGFAKNTGVSFCSNCGARTFQGQVVCTTCGFSLNQRVSYTGAFMRANEGKIVGGVFSGMEKYRGLNKWIGRSIVVFLPLWPIWIIAYFIICLATPMDE